MKYILNRKKIDGKKVKLNIKDYNNDEFKYLFFKTAYNPNSEYAGKIVKVPEDYLYKNNRHHLKDLIIVDSKKNKEGKVYIIGFLGTSKLKKRTVKLNDDKLIAVNKNIVTHDSRKRNINLSKTRNTNLNLNYEQLKTIKKISENNGNIKKSVLFSPKRKVKK